VEDKNNMSRKTANKKYICYSIWLDKGSLLEPIRHPDDAKAKLVTGYDRGGWWLVPNPDNTELAADVARTHGHLPKQSRYMSRSDFENIEHWVMPYTL